MSKPIAKVYHQNGPALMTFTEKDTQTPLEYATAYVGRNPTAVLTIYVATQVVRRKQVPVEIETLDCACPNNK